MTADPVFSFFDLDLGALRADLRRDEGLRLRPYRDSQGVLTIGVGRNLDHVGLSEAEALMLLDNDIASAIAGLDRALPWWRRLTPEQRRGLLNMAFNLGLTRLLRFERTLAALQAGNGQAAAAEALNSKWADQVGARAQRIARLFHPV